MNTPLPRPIHIDEFLPLRGRTLIADCEPRAVELELLEVTPLVNHAKLDRPPFILVFRSLPEAMLTTGAYVLSGNGFGPDLVHLIQITKLPNSPPGHYYQAVFN